MKLSVNLTSEEFFNLKNELKGRAEVYASLAEKDPDCLKQAESLNAIRKKLVASWEIASSPGFER